MLSKNQSKLLRSLRLKKNRYQHRQFLVEGETVVGEILAAMPAVLQRVLCTSAYSDSLSKATLKRLGGKLVVCDEPTLQSISTLDNPSPVIALLEMPREMAQWQPIAGLALYLDGIRDPGNLGTIIRVADWFGLNAVFLAPDCVDVYNPKTIQASMGSFLRVRFPVASIAQIHAFQPELAILGTSIDSGVDALRFAWPTDGLLVIGSESHGVRREAANLISTWLNIPRGATAAGAESLNAAVATGILGAAYLQSTR